MGIIFHLFLGFVTSFLGTLFPSMLSMTTVKISIKETQKKANSFAAGVSLVVIIQAYIAVEFSKVLVENPDFLMTLQQFGTFVFAGLSIFFFNQARKAKKKNPNKKERKIKGFVSGLLFSSLNMFAIPFYFGVTSTLIMMHWYEFNTMNNITFVLGSALGTFILLFLYAQTAKKIEKKMQHLANQMDLILGIVTGLIVVINLSDLFL